MRFQKINKRIQRITTLALTGILCLTCGFPCLAKETEYYNRVISDYESNGISTPDLSLRIPAGSMADVVGHTPAAAERKGSIFWTEETEAVSWNFKLPRGGLYWIKVCYLPGEGSTLSPARKVLINGKLPFSEASKVLFERTFADAGKPIVNALGDDVCPMQKEISVWKEKTINDSIGISCSPLEFYFEAGANTLTMEYISEPFALEWIEICPVKTLPTYAEVSSEYTASKAEQSLYVEAEDSNLIIGKSASSILSQSNSDPATSPYEATHIRLNTIGGYSWLDGHGEIQWKIDIPQTGLYKIHFRFLQNWNSGLSSYRSLRINGEIPFAEMGCIVFPYSTKWQDCVLSDPNGDAYLFELQKGENILSMQVELGPMVEVIEQLSDTSDTLSSLIFDITHITGYTPDPNYNYSLESEIPDLIDRMTGIYNEIESCWNTIHSLATKNSTMEGNFKSALTDLKALIERPTFISTRLDDLNTMLTNLSDWSATLKTAPLALDYFEILAPNQKETVRKASAWDRISATLKNFAVSFVKNYNAVSAEKDTRETLDVWVSRGKEWAKLICEISDSSFTQETGIGVNFHVLPSGSISSSVNPLLLALSSGITPDAVMGLSYDLPVEYALRNTVCDLTGFKDFTAVSERFSGQSLVPFTYDGHVYALPETTSFRVMYYRTDIFERLGLSVPQTWDEVYDDVLPVLSRNNMKIFVPQILDLFLYQSNGSYYSEDGTSSALNTPEAYTAFKELCELYTENDVPVSASFYNRFRTGEIPMGIENASQYLLLSYAAPEIAGDWAIAPVPGHKNEDGTVNRTNSGSAVDGCIILENSKHKESAWQFFKWWTSTETQTAFAELVEGRIGSTARWFSANREAFNALPWSKSDRVAINSALQNLKETPVVLGSYFAGRHLTNAINRTVIQGQSPRDSLEEAVEQINMELKRRQRGYYKRQEKKRTEGS